MLRSAARHRQPQAEAVLVAQRNHALVSDTCMPVDSITWKSRRNDR